MKKQFGRFVGVLLLLLSMIAVNACSKKTVPVQSGPGTISGGTDTGQLGFRPDEAKWREMGLFTEPERRQFLEKAQEFENEDIYFDFDSYLLSSDAREVLNAKADFLKRYPKVVVVVEGHCDERGTNEYNLALGESRAQSAFQYLVNSGIDENRLNTISYGEERPQELGQNEEAWSMNRRDHFILNY